VTGASLTLGKGNRVRMFEEGVLRRTVGLKGRKGRRLEEIAW
jgi:hypothetical protein